MWITAVVLNGVALELDDVIADAVIRQGHAAIDESGNASAAQLRLEGITRAYSRPFMVGVPLVITADGAPRFTGTVTDAELDDDVLTLIGAGVLSTLVRYTVGAVDWPAETWSVRVLRCFAEAGLSPLLVLEYDAAFDPLLVARLADPVTLDQYLAELSDDVGAVIFDTPDGHVLVQQLSSRQPAATLVWRQVPRATTWADATGTWATATTLHAVDPSYPPGVIGELDPADVLYVPPWVQALELENQTSVELGDQATVVTATDPSSVAAFGPYPGPTISTELSLPADGTTRAGQRVARRSTPRWSIPAVTILRGVELALGRQLIISGFPASSPFETWAPVVEGWTDTIQGALWNIDVTVSDPALSGLVLVWSTVPAGLTWAEVVPTCRWLDATRLDALYPLTRELELV